MKKNAIIAAAVIASGMGVGATHPALAAPNAGVNNNQVSEAQAALSAKISMESAIKSAEMQTGGQAIEASFGNENGQTGYDITTITRDGSEKSVFVDATSGKVMAAAKSDSENENEGHENSGQ